MEIDSWLTIPSPPDDREVGSAIVGHLEEEQLLGYIIHDATFQSLAMLDIKEEMTGFVRPGS